MPRQRRERLQNIGGPRPPSARQWFQDAPPRRPVFFQQAALLIQVAHQQHSGAVIQWMRHRGRRMDPIQSMSGERQLVKERRTRPYGIYGRSEIMPEARQPQLERADAPTRD